MADIPKPFGLALSGGGFRATAFHLGVLRRLRELGLLKQIDVISTVSGGSITGAAWVHWQANHGDTINDPAEWSRFESALIDFMHFGLRERVVLFGFVVPFVLVATALLGAYAWLGAVIDLGSPGLARPIALGFTFALAGALAYAIWHYSAARIFQSHLDRAFFKRALLHKLLPDTSNRAFVDRYVPFLIMNATGLNSGDHLLFSPPARYPYYFAQDMFIRALPDRSGIPRAPKRWAREPTNRDTAPRVSMGNGLISQAVVASCTIPSIFAPIRVRDPEPFWEVPTWWPGYFQAVDGGVGDNQGIQFLINGHCRTVLVSDAARALKTETKPSTWQFLPPGRGVVFRSQDIIYERMRDWGYRCLEERSEFYKILRDTGGLEEAERRGAPLLEGFAFVEIWPHEGFRWRHKARLPNSFHRLLGNIRTDLDRFSDEEISALMYHGYTSVDHCIRSYQPDWIGCEDIPLNFPSKIGRADMDWPAMSSEQIIRMICYLSGSDYRLRLKRLFWRWRVRRKARQIAREGQRAS